MSASSVKLNGGNNERRFSGSNFVSSKFKENGSNNNIKENGLIISTYVIPDKTDNLTKPLKNPAPSLTNPRSSQRLKSVSHGNITGMPNGSLIEDLNDKDQQSALQTLLISNYEANPNYTKPDYNQEIEKAVKNMTTLEAIDPINSEPEPDSGDEKLSIIRADTDERIKTQQEIEEKLDEVADQISVNDHQSLNFSQDINLDNTNNSDSIDIKRDNQIIEQSPNHLDNNTGESSYNKKNIRKSDSIDIINMDIPNETKNHVSHSELFDLSEKYQSVRLINPIADAFHMLHKVEWQEDIIKIEDNGPQFIEPELTENYKVRLNNRTIVQYDDEDENDESDGNEHNVILIHDYSRNDNEIVDKSKVIDNQI